MTFIPVTEIPKRGRVKGQDLRLALNNFMRMRVKIAKVCYSEGEYLNPVSCGTSLRGGIERLGYPVIVEISAGEVYLVRLDM